MKKKWAYMMNVYHLTKYLGNMEWTKEKLLNTCITMKSVAHAVRIVEFYKSFGLMTDVDLKQVPKHYNKKDVGMYIGMDSSIDAEGKICHGWWPNALPKYVNEIKLPSKTRRKFPREMMVSDDKITWWKRCVITKAGNIGLYIAMKSPWTIGDVCNQYKGWPYAREIK